MSLKGNLFHNNSTDISDGATDTIYSLDQIADVGESQTDGFPAGYVFDVTGGTVAANELVDKSEVFTGDALDKLSQITYKGDTKEWAKLDHDTLPAELRHDFIKRKYIHKVTGQEYGKLPMIKIDTDTWKTDNVSNYNVVITSTPGRKVYRNIQMNTRATIQLKALIDVLVNEIGTLQNRITQLENP